jgi:5-methylcytosine-specific restriction enzyme subunit McrC
VRTLEFHDLSPFTATLDAGDDAWLAKLADVDPRAYRISIADGHGHDDEWLPLVERSPDGQWWAGRFIGAITYEGRRLIVLPRLGVEVVEAWLDQAFGLAAPPASSRREESTTFIARLLARLWCRSVDSATRHGLPLLRLPRRHEGLYVRGRLDLPRTLELMGEGRLTLASVTQDRSLAHPVTRAIVCAEHALARRLATSGEWRTERVRQVLPHLRAGVGSRPRLPKRHELDRVRYTPITMPFKQAALLSHRIASGLGYGATEEHGQAEGILLDVAELWELFVLNCARLAAPTGMRVEHGTTAGQSERLLCSWRGDRGMGVLKPDLIVRDAAGVVAIIDAKYKRLTETRVRPNGVDQADLYQLAAYASRFQPSRFAALIYPRSEHEGATAAIAEAHGPWRGGETNFIFRRLATNAADCRAELSAAFTQGVN